MTYLTTAQINEIKTTDLSDNPGLLPFLLGNAKIQYSNHHVIHYLDIKPINDLLTTLEKSLNNTIRPNIQTFLQTNPQLHEAYLHDLNHDLDYCYLLLSKNYQKYNNVLLIHDKRKHSKRGLVNILGNGIKFITGNLDNSDAERYDNLITTLQQNQDDIKLQTLTRASLNAKLMNNFKNVLVNLTENQYLLESQINILTQRADAQKKQLLIEFINDQLMYIHNLLTDIETALSFTRKGTLHTSVVQPQLLYDLLTNITKIYGPDQLPFPGDDLLRYYEIIKVRVYIEDTTINFILDIPVVKVHTYKYYYLIPIPNKNNTMVHYLKPYAIIHGKDVWYSDNTCQRFGSTYICSQKLQEALHNDCIGQLINKQRITCPLVKNTKLSKSIIEQIDSRHYLIIPTETLPIDSNCKNSNFIKTPSLLELPKNCFLTIKGLTFMNSDTNKIKNEIILPNLIFSNSTITSQVNLNKINLAEVYKNLQQLEKVYHTPIMETVHKYSFIPVYLIIICFIIFAISFYYYKIKTRKTVTIESLKLRLNDLISSQEAETASS